MALGLIVAAILGIAFFVTQPIVVLSRRRSGAEASVERLRAHVEKLSRDLAPRSVASLANLDAAAAYIRQAWTGFGVHVEEQRYVSDGHAFCNVIARLGPDSGERIVVGAHYDAYGHMPGADDNASGAAGLIELARLLSERRLATAVELVGFTLEEPPGFGSPAMGSAVHVQSLLRDHVRVRAMLCLEMIGCFSDRPGSQTFPVPAMGLLYPGRGNFIAVAGRFADRSLLRRVKRAMAAEGDLPVRSICAPTTFGGMDLSDHVNYWKAGIPAVLITDTAFFRNPRYHTAADTSDTLDYRRMADTVTQIAAAVTELASRP